MIIGLSLLAVILLFCLYNLAIQNQLYMEEEGIK